MLDHTEHFSYSMYITTGSDFPAGENCPPPTRHFHDCKSGSSLPSHYSDFGPELHNSSLFHIIAPSDSSRPELGMLLGIEARPVLEQQHQSSCLSGVQQLRNDATRLDETTIQKTTTFPFARTADRRYLVCLLSLFLFAGGLAWTGAGGA
jgi:hypothetical protein